MCLVSNDRLVIGVLVATKNRLPIRVWEPVWSRVQTGLSRHIAWLLGALGLESVSVHQKNSCLEIGKIVYSVFKLLSNRGAGSGALSLDNCTDYSIMAPNTCIGSVANV